MSMFLISYLGALAAIATAATFAIIYETIALKKEGEENGKRENRKD